MTPPPARDRSAAYRRGHFAEHVAALFLIAKGFTILARRYAAHGGEITSSPADATCWSSSR